MTKLKLKKYKGFFYREKSQDKYVIDESFSNKGYYKNLKFNIKDNFTVIDIGANIGAFTVPVAKIAKKVFSFEPEKDNFSLLKKNIKLNNLKNVYLFNCGILYKDGKKKLFLTPKPGGEYSLYLKSDYPEIIKVISLRRVFEDNSIEFCHFLKIDAEGSEYEILKNLPSDYFKKIGIIALEYHDYIVKNELKNIIKLLIDTGFKLKVIYEDYPKRGIIIAKKSKKSFILYLTNHLNYFISRIDKSKLPPENRNYLKIILKKFDRFLGQGGIFLRKILKK